MHPAPVTPPLSDDDRRLAERALTVAEDLLDDLAPFLLDHAGDVPAARKADGSPVTPADVQSAQRLTAGLTAAFPDHTVLTEESTTTWDGTRWAWVVDPIDGTSNYASGVPYWCVSVALCLDGNPVVAVVDAPPVGRRYTAVRGAGAHLQRRGETHRLSAGPAVDFRSGQHGHVPVAVSAGTIRRASGRVRLNPRILGAYALDLAQVAAGSLVAAWIRNPKVWDAAAGALLVQEAGGAVLQEGRGLLPMARDVDLARRPAGMLVGADEAWLRDLHHELTV